ncbi:spore coat protein [Solibacillus daqui]|uniref:spore coat protein n=1 Tax=Solibacillus daqui TaxID=2912187 RepID=UPI002366EDBD|nr:spore coat protein [Solibacillus daqui]
MASFEIGSRSLFNFRNERFFLLVEDEITVPDKGVEIESINIYEIDQQTFNFIRDEGDTPVVVPVLSLPTVPPGFELERKCIFTVDNAYYVIYDLENGTDSNVILRIGAALFNSMRNSGVRECIPQNFIN